MNNLHLISKYAICYGVFFLSSFISKTEHSNRLYDSKGTVSSPGILLGLQAAGILWLGIVPFFILHYSLNDIVIGQQAPTIVQLCSLLLLLIASIAIASGSAIGVITKSVTDRQIVFHFSKKFTSTYFLSRTLFLICYELFFRGYLLSDAIHRMGIGTAILVNTGLYCFLHVFNDKKEIIACVLFGIILCSVCLWFRAAWPAIVIHIVFSLTYELKLLKTNPYTANKIQHENIYYRRFGLHRK